MQESCKNRRRHLPVLFGFLGLILFINLFSSTNFRILSVIVNIKCELGYSPQTRVVLPLIGQIAAPTHWLPIRLSLELKSVDLALIKLLGFSPSLDVDILLDALNERLFRILFWFVLKLLALGATGTTFFLYLVGIKRPKKLIKGALLSALVILFIVAILYATYDFTGFESLEYEGIIEAAPWLLNLTWEALDRVEELGGRIQVLASNLYSVLQEVERLGPLDLVQGEVVVLHVSDIHNNPVAYSFAKQIVDSFPVDFIVDTGDITDWGTALETEIIGRIQDLNLPYLFVSGNHDSPQVLSKLDSLLNAILVETEEIAICGLRIAGTGDLVADSYLATPASLKELTAYAIEISEKWAQVENPPDIFMVHNHRVAENLQSGLFPVVVYGHTHSWSLTEKGGTVYINAGTTGAAGIRGFQSREPLPYSLSLLYFSRDQNNKLRLEAVDGIHVTGRGTSFSLNRTHINGRNFNDDVEDLP